MSGGKWQYLSWQINQVACDIEQRIIDAEKGEWKPETLQRFREGAACLRRAAVWEHRLDWLLSNDDGEESFHRRLADDLAKLEGYTPSRGVPVSITTAIMKAIEKGSKPHRVFLLQQHYDALIQAVGNILAYNESLRDA